MSWWDRQVYKSTALAGSSNQGLVSASAQTFAGDKTFTGNVTTQLKFKQKVGGSSDYATAIGVYKTSSVGAVGNTAATLTTLKTLPIGASALVANADSIRGAAWGSFSASGSVNKRLLLTWAGATIYDSGLLAVVSLIWKLDFEIIRSGSTTALCLARYAASNNFNNVVAASIATTWTNANDILVQGNGTLANDTSCSWARADYVPAAP